MRNVSRCFSVDSKRKVGFSNALGYIPELCGMTDKCNAVYLGHKLTVGTSVSVLPSMF